MAKTCLLCGADAADDAATCPNDGEASWAGVADAPVTIPEQPTSDGEAPKPKTRRK